MMIHLSELDRAFPYRNRYASDGDALLEQSIKSHGILSPVSIFEEDEKKTLLSGHKRLAAAEKLGLKEIPVEVCKAEPDEKKRFLQALLSNWGQQRSELDILFVAVKALRDFKFDEEEFNRDIMPAIGLGPQKHFIQEILKMQALEPAVLKAIEDDTIPYRGAHQLLKFPPEDQGTFIREIASVLKLSSSQLQQSVECLYDLMRQNKASLKDLVRAKHFQHVLRHEKWDNRQKTDIFMKMLRQIKNPRLAEVEKEFNGGAASICGQLNDLKIEAPPFFEEQGYFLSMHIRNSDSLEELQKLLQEQRSSLNALLKCVL